MTFFFMFGKNHCRYSEKSILQNAFLQYFKYSNIDLIMHMHVIKGSRKIDHLLGEELWFLIYLPVPDESYIYHSQIKSYS